MYILADNITSPLGPTTRDTFAALRAGLSGVRQHRRPEWSDAPFQAALIDDEALDAGLTALGQTPARWTRFEKLVLASALEALSHTDVRADDPETVFILSTTKGNIALLETEAPDCPDLRLHHTAQKIARTLGNPNLPLVVDQACISGVAALLLGKRLLDSGRYRHAVVTGADEVSRFILSGFQSFQALSDERCRPFDQARKGLNLGEGSATMVLSADARPGALRILGGSASNDANHISGPSRTGAELSQAVGRALQEAGLAPAGVDFISAHGTATPYNDEMEAKAFELAGLQATPLNSLKAFFGHTLGAAGLIESVVSAESLRQGWAVPTLGFEQSGVSRPVRVLAEPLERAFRVCLKTASGFGGCNGALVLGR